MADPSGVQRLQPCNTVGQHACGRSDFSASAELPGCSSSLLQGGCCDLLVADQTEVGPIHPGISSGLLQVYPCMCQYQLV